MPSFKNLTVKVKFQEKVVQFDCKPHELEETISAHFKINLRDFTIFSVVKGEKKQISLHDVTDMMKILIEPPITAQHNIQESDASKTIIENITSKLIQNAPLNGQERSAIIEALQIHGISLFRKRKLRSIDICTNDRPKCLNKEVQVHMPKTPIKHSSVQTSPVCNTSEIDNSINDDSNDVKYQLRLKRSRVEETVTNGVNDDLMEKTFHKRRFFIYEGPLVSEVKKEYPALFCFDEVKQELDRIFYRGKSEKFLKKLNIYTKHILHYKDSQTRDIFKKIKKAVSAAETLEQKTYIENVGSVLVLAKLLDGNFGFIHLSDEPISEKVEEYGYPYINAARYELGDIFSDKVHYDVMVESERLCETSNFCDAILCFVASFFIFLISYPANCYNTLIAFEKLYLEATETEKMDEYTEQLIEIYKDKVLGGKERVSSQ